MIWSTIVTNLASVDCTTLKRDAWWTPNKVGVVGKIPPLRSGPGSGLEDSATASHPPQIVHSFLPEG